MISITPEAAKKLKELMSEENKYLLRVFVQGGGCSGFQYGMMLEETNGPSDQVFESDEIKIIVDPISISYLKGAEIDYFSGSSGVGFSFKNPNATSTCGCGQSFNTE